MDLQSVFFLIQMTKLSPELVTFPPNLGEKLLFQTYKLHYVQKEFRNFDVRNI